jgi:hypothetical protein
MKRRSWFGSIFSALFGFLPCRPVVATQIDPSRSKQVIEILYPNGEWKTIDSHWDCPMGAVMRMTTTHRGKTTVIYCHVEETVEDSQGNIWANLAQHPPLPSMFLVKTFRRVE